MLNSHRNKITEEDIYRQYFTLDPESVQAEYDTQVVKKFAIEQEIEKLKELSRGVSVRLVVLDCMQYKAGYNWLISRGVVNFDKSYLHSLATKKWHLAKFPRFKPFNH